MKAVRRERSDALSDEGLGATVALLAKAADLLNELRLARRVPSEAQLALLRACCGELGHLIAALRRATTS